MFSSDVYFDPCYKHFKNTQAAKIIFDDINFFACDVECQIVNVPRLRTKECKADFISDVNKMATSIVKFDSLDSFKYEYNNVFRGLKNNPVPVYFEETEVIDDYKTTRNQQEKAKEVKLESGDIFKRDGENYVKEDIIMNIIKKLNKN